MTLRTRLALLSASGVYESELKDLWHRRELGMVYAAQTVTQKQLCTLRASELDRRASTAIAGDLLAGLVMSVPMRPSEIELVP
jgi:hypothetical protein